MAAVTVLCCRNRLQELAVDALVAKYQPFIADETIVCQEFRAHLRSAKYITDLMAVLGPQQQHWEGLQHVLLCLEKAVKTAKTQAMVWGGGVPAELYRIWDNINLQYPDFCTLLTWYVGLVELWCTAHSQLATLNKHVLALCYKTQLRHLDLSSGHTANSNLLLGNLILLQRVMKHQIRCTAQALFDLVPSRVRRSEQLMGMLPSNAVSALEQKQQAEAAKAAAAAAAPEQQDQPMVEQGN